MFNKKTRTPETRNLICWNLEIYKRKNQKPKIWFVEYENPEPESQKPKIWFVKTWDLKNQKFRNLKSGLWKQKIEKTDDSELWELICGNWKSK